MKTPTSSSPKGYRTALHAAIKDLKKATAIAEAGDSDKAQYIAIRATRYLGTARRILGKASMNP